MNVRTAQPRDLLGIVELDQHAWCSNRHWEGIPDGEHAWRIWIESALVLIVDRDGSDEPAGVAVAFPGLDGALCLHKIFVSGECRGSGLGGRLMAEVLAYADEAGRAVWLTVDPDNERAVALYRKYGFGVERRVDGFYRAEEPRLIMRRPAQG